MTEGEFAELFTAMISRLPGSLPTGWEIQGLDVGEVLVKADHGQVFRMVVTISDDEF